MITTELSGLKFYHESISLETGECLEFIDITDRVIDLVRGSGVIRGLANVQTRHTTTAICVGENEPLLLGDLGRLLHRLAPPGDSYQHDNFAVRTVNLCPDERKNGHSHCKAIFLRTAETLNVVDGTVQLGQWQRLFLIELDHAQRRTISVVILGAEA